MRSLSLFTGLPYAILPGIWATSLSTLDTTDLLEHCQPTGVVHDACCRYETVEDVNAKLLPILDKLVNTTVFRYFKVNLKKECPFWDVHELCSVTDCTVSEADESEIPKQFQSESLSAVDFSRSSAFSLLKKKCPPSDKDFCILDDDLSEDGVFVNLRKNPERYTGYAGESAAKVWAAIYNENCFGIDDVPIAQNGIGPSSLKKSCTEKRVFYKLLSGLHTSISMHICEEYFDRETQQWIKNLDCFKYRIGNHPDRIENLYFLWAVGLRAVSKLSPYLKHYPFCNGSVDEEIIKEYVNQVVAMTSKCPSTFHESTLFQSEDSNDLKLQFRDHFRNISMIMDCVGCQKCRLWGKVQVSGLGTALKILFSYPEKAKKFKLTRAELVALLNGFHRLSESIRALQSFRAMMQEEVAQSEAVPAAVDPPQAVNTDTAARQETPVTDAAAELLQRRALEEWAQQLTEGASKPHYMWSFGFGLVILVLSVARMIYLGFSRDKQFKKDMKKKNQ